MVSLENSGMEFVQARLTPHMLVGLPSASSGVRFLLNFLPPRSLLVIM